MPPDELMKLILLKLDNLSADVGSVKADLREHMRRTSSNEANLDLLRKEFSPIKTHVAVVGGIAKWLVGGGLIGVVGLVLRLAGLI